jgi:hypothetical protein
VLTAGPAHLLRGDSNLVGLLLGLLLDELHHLLRAAGRLSGGLRRGAVEATACLCDLLLHLRVVHRAWPVSEQHRAGVGGRAGDTPGWRRARDYHNLGSPGPGARGDGLSMQKGRHAVCVSTGQPYLIAERLGCLLLGASFWCWLTVQAWSQNGFQRKLWSRRIAVSTQDSESCNAKCQATRVRSNLAGTSPRLLLGIPLRQRELSAQGAHDALKIRANGAHPARKTA